jgi:hypothetical protein
MIGVNGWGLLNTEFAEDTESQRRGDELRMWIGKHGRGYHGEYQVVKCFAGNGRN